MNVSREILQVILSQYANADVIIFFYNHFFKKYAWSIEVSKFWVKKLPQEKHQTVSANM